jgi:membrane protease YdiL (CAAX protease family)
MTTRAVASGSGRDTAADRQRVLGRGWRILAAVEMLLAGGAVVADLFLPTLALLALAGLSLAVRRRGLGSLGLHRPANPWSLVCRMLAFSAAWTGVSLALFIPVANNLTGETQDTSVFAELEGDLGMLALLLVLTWTLAAFGEELAYRGYVLTRLTDLLGSGHAAVAAAVLLSSVLFGLMHTEQGSVGILIATLDGVAYAVLRLRYGTVWAPVLAHGFINTIGFVAFFFLGPVDGLW